jgi:hypothetical protein
MRPLEFREIARPIDDPDHLHTMLDQPIKSQPPFNYKHSGILSDFRTRLTVLIVIYQYFKRLSGTLSGTPPEVMLRDLGKAKRLGQ